MEQALRSAARVVLRTVNAPRAYLKMRGPAVGYDDPRVAELVKWKTLNNPLGESEQLRGRVLDLGGAFGAHYSSSNHDGKWAVVEQQSFVERARDIETANLRFFTSLGAATNWLGGVDTFHSSGTLFCMPDWRATLRDVQALGAKDVIWLRMRMHPTREEARKPFRTMLSMHGPGPAPSDLADVPVEALIGRIPEDEFIEMHRDSSYGLLLADGEADSRKLSFRLL